MPGQCSIGSRARRATDRLHRRVGTERATYALRNGAPKGRTPIVRFHFNWTHISVIAGLGPTNCMFRPHEGSIEKEQHVGFLETLRAHLEQPLPIVRDSPQAHRSKPVRAYLDLTEGAVQVAFLPPHSPDLNPAELPWAWLERHALAKFCPANLDELNVAARNELESAQHRPSIIAAAGFEPDSGDVSIYRRLNSPESATVVGQFSVGVNSRASTG